MPFFKVEEVVSTVDLWNKFAASGTQQISSNQKLQLPPPPLPQKMYIYIYIYVYI